MLKIQNVIKGVFSTLFGIAAMTYAGYGWHVEWLTDTEALVVGSVGFILLFLRAKLEESLSKFVGELPAMVWQKFFGKKSDGQ